MVSQSFGGAATPFSLLLPAASCSALSAQPLAGAWTALNHAACNMFLLKIIVVINALSFSAAICLNASHNGYFPFCSPKREGGGKKGQRELHVPFPSTSASAVGAARSRRDSKRHQTSSELEVTELKKRHAWKKVLTQSYNFS